MLDFSKIKTYPIKERKNLENVLNFSKLDDSYAKIENPDIDALASAAASAYKNKKQVIVMCGGHVVKTGQTPYIIDLMKRGIITHVAVNGAFSVHDFEISLIGETSEDVADALADGSFGMAEETGRLMNDAIKEGAAEGIGYGKAIGRKIEQLSNKYKDYSVLWNACKLNIPATVHVAIGTDIIHQHPSCDGSALGKASYDDFKIFTESISKLEEGVCINIGCAVIMPEVFLKALSISRNLGCKTDKITTANLDQIDHYRPRENVVKRPTSLGGKGYVIIGKHQRTIPTLYHGVISRLTQ